MSELYHSQTEGIRIVVRPRFAPEHSDPNEPRYVFIYHIRIENVGERTAELLTRHWHIHDPMAGDSVVDGDGVVGEQPVLAPGDVHEYESFCVLRAAAGYMEGTYHFRRPGGDEFDAAIPRFMLTTSS